MARTFGKVRFNPTTKRWYIDVRPHGRIFSVLVGGRGRRIVFRDRDLADEILGMIRAEILGGLSESEALAPYLEGAGATVEAKVREYIGHYRRLVEAGERSPTSLRVLEAYANPGGHWSYLFPLSLQQLHYATLDDWSGWLDGRRLSAKTKRNVMGAFRAAMGHWHRRGEIREVPRMPEIRWNRPTPRIISVATQEAILAEIPEPKRGIFLALVENPMRPGEARALTVADYDWRTGRCRVSAALKGAHHSAPRRTTKTGDVRGYEASPRLRAWLDAHIPLSERLNGSRPLFANPQGQDSGRWTHSALYATWSAAARSVGVEVSLYEGTKHSTLTALRRAGVPLDVLQAAAGHRDIRSTERYAQLADDAVIEALKRRAQ